MVMKPKLIIIAFLAIEAIIWLASFQVIKQLVTFGEKISEFTETLYATDES